jgi:hypothetical protein
VEINTRQIGFEKFLLAEVAAMHVGFDLLKSPLASEFWSRDRPSRWCPPQNDHQGKEQGPQPEDTQPWP